MQYVHIPVDFKAPTELDLQKFFAEMDAFRGQKALVHCAANKIVTAFLGLHLTNKLGWPAEKAFALMDSISPNLLLSCFTKEALGH
jgi:hypothetical protein